MYSWQQMINTAKHHRGSYLGNLKKYVHQVNRFVFMMYFVLCQNDFAVFARSVNGRHKERTIFVLRESLYKANSGHLYL